jgi:hypothetical protein
MATTSNTFARKKKNRLSATRPLRPAKLPNLFLRGALDRYAGHDAGVLHYGSY